MTVYHRRDTPISGELLVMKERTLHLESNNTEATSGSRQNQTVGASRSTLAPKLRFL